MEEMRAALFDRYGPPEVLYTGTVPMPQRTPGEVLVRVRTVSVNGGETAVRRGEIPFAGGVRFPKRMGIDFVGEVAEVDPHVRGLTPGDRVWGVLGRTPASVAEYVSVRPRKLAFAPGNLTDAEAVTLLAGGTTGLTALRDKAHLQPGERLLVRGASGGVGSLGVQLGKVLGAHVTGLAGPKNLDFVRELGADEVFDYTTTTSPSSQLGRFDVILDTVGTQQPLYRRLLTPEGRMVAIAFDISRIPTSLGYLLASTVHGSRRVRFFSGNPHHPLLAELAHLAESDTVRPVVDAIHPLTELAAAHRALEAGGVRGKHVVEVG